MRLLLAGAAAICSPALGQDHNHADAVEAQAEQANPHAGHDMSQDADPHAGHDMSQDADPHAGHEMPVQADAHAGHDMSAANGTPPVAPPPPEAFSGPEHAADLVYGDTAMAASRREMRRIHGALPAHRVLIDRLEAKVRNGRNGYALEGEAWYGGDIDKLWLKAEGEGEFGAGLEGLEMQALWSHAIGPFFDAQTGVRRNFGPGPDRTDLTLAVQGLAPYWFEVEAAAFLSNKGDLTAAFEVEHDTRITQSLILQPHGELTFALQDVPEIHIGSGVTEAALGARLRYEIVPEFAPYVGVEWSRAFGRTARFLRDEGEDTGGFSVVTGVRFWF